MTTFNFENNNTVCLDEYPPPPVAWFLLLVDSICYPLKCSGWRETLGVPEGSWLSFAVPSIADQREKYPLTTFLEFVSQQREQGEFSSYGGYLYKYAFEEPSTALCDLLTPTGILTMVLVLIILRRISSWLIPWFCSLARASALETRGEEWVKANPRVIEKVGETAYCLLMHFILAAHGVYFFSGEDWWARDTESDHILTWLGLNFNGTTSLFKGFLSRLVIKPSMAWYYILQAAYNTDCMIRLLLISFSMQLRWPVFLSHRRQTTGTIVATQTLQGPAPLYYWQSPIIITWSPTVRGDFAELAFHDVLSNALVYGSSYCRLGRVGSMVSLVHDVSAVAVKISKLTNFLQWRNVNLVAFTLMLVTWFITRLYILPFVIWYGISQNAYYLMELDELNPMLFQCYRSPFLIGIAALCALQVYWFNSYMKLYLKLLQERRSDRTIDMIHNKRIDPTNPLASTLQEDSTVVKYHYD